MWKKQQIDTRALEYANTHVDSQRVFVNIINLFCKSESYSRSDSNYKINEMTKIKEKPFNVGESTNLFSYAYAEYTL